MGVVLSASPGWVFKVYKKRIIQDLEIKPVNTCYYSETWQDAAGKYHYAPLPAHLRHTDFGLH